ncbi:amine oxidase [Plectosphaerella plurivora]|uniref:Amine oxidase n=1 Tax=Plectosphaerella plurivora TaxID=936078 RepID=A0A9P8VDK1_9PEZI|nr:amine oxidase [Plectosphaerella plurivora]
MITVRAQRALCAPASLRVHHLSHARHFATTSSPTQHSPRAAASSPSDTDFDALVIGAGAGGVTAASLLAKNGYRTLMVEAEDRIGGRASTRPIDGFLVNTGAFAIELDGAVAKTYRDLGLTLRLHETKRASTVLRFGGRDLNLSEGPAGVLRRIGPVALASASKILPFLRPKKGESTRSWLNRLFTRNSTIHGIIDNVLGAMFAARGDDIPAEVLLQYFTKDTSFKRIGFPPGGTIEVWKPLAKYVESNGGQVWLGSKVSKLIFGPDGQVTGALVRRKDGSEVQVNSKVTVSNIGPLGTVQLAGPDNFPPDYASRIQRWNDPAAIITVHFTSEKPLASFPFLALIGKARRMVYAGNFSAPELQRTPKGWHLYCGASVPIPARGAFDLEKEKELLFADLRDQFPGFDQAKVLAVDVTAHEWPAQRAVSGFDELSFRFELRSDLPLDIPILPRPPRRTAAT